MRGSWGSITSSLSLSVYTQHAGESRYLLCLVVVPHERLTTNCVIDDLLNFLLLY